jgi:predicted ATPase
MGFQVLEERETEDPARPYGPCATLSEIILPAPRFDTCSTLSYIQITGKGKRGLSVHLKRVRLHPEQYPTKIHYPFNLDIFCETTDVVLASPITFFVGENGTGKSTFLQAISNRCRIHLWKDNDRCTLEANPYEQLLYRYLEVEWAGEPVAGSFFSSQLFHHFAQNLDEWAASDPGMLEYFGGKSLNALSHGQSLMSFFRARYQIRGLYLLDEPETALSPRSELEFVRLIREMGEMGHAQFIIATHSPILMACPGASIFTFDEVPLKTVEYEETEHYRVYKAFMADRSKFW